VPPIKLQAFGGMIPVMDDRLLPGSNAADAQNVWLYSGALQGIRAPRDIHTFSDPNTRYAYRIPKTSDTRDFTNSYWLEFTTTDTSVVKSPVAESSDPAYYFANGNAAPGYNTLSRIAAGNPNLVLGIPQPSVAPTLVHSGGVSTTNDTRSYVYTWVSQFGEEGPPSDPSIVTTGKIDDTWAVTLTAPSGADTTGRVLTKTRIYRTVTNDQGTATYFFVAELAIATLTYNDNATIDAVAANEELASTDWIGPPSDLEGMAAMPNGVIAGWKANEIWFCEPYRPHAWPAKYQIATEFPIIAMMASGQTLVVGTQGVPYLVSGTSPDTMTLQRVSAVEPCVSRGSMAATPLGVLYASQNGLISVTAGGVQNLTRNLISKDKWASLLDLKQLRAAILNEAYMVYCGVTEQAFEVTAFETTAFQQADGDGTRKGALIEGQEQRVGFARLEADGIVYNVIQDQWSGEAFLIRSGKVQMVDLTYDVLGEYSWTSKIFSFPHPMNLGAAKVTWDLPDGVTGPTATIYIYADGVLRQTKTLPASDQVFRLKSGFLSDNYQIRVEGTLVIKQIQLASTIEELRAI
jgi:hypothetical protein